MMSKMMTNIVTKKPWGHEELWASTDGYVGKILFIKKGHRLSRQYHVVKEETIMVLEGMLYIEIGENGEQQMYLPAGYTFHVEPKTVHRFCAVDQDVRLVEVSTPHLQDVVRLEDDYNRG